MFQPDDPRNIELLVDVGTRGHFPATEKIELGTHYDLIHHLWQKCNSWVGTECRWIVAFRPALVHPETGVAFAIAMGTNYYLRITAELRAKYVDDLHAMALADAKRIGVTDDNLEQYVSTRNGESDIGPSWAKGWFLHNEDEYIRYAYKDCS